MTDINLTINLLTLVKIGTIAFLTTLFCIRLLHPVACHIGLVDHPGGRKWHENDVPLIGGITMFFGLCFALLMLPFSLNQYRGLLAGSGLLVLIGVVDDFRELGSKRRLLGQLFACLLLMLWGDKYVTNLGDLLFLGDLHLKALSPALTAIAVIGYINAMNMVDGQDGLAGGIALTQTLLLIFLSAVLNEYKSMQMLMILAVLLTAFLLFNMPTPWRNKAAIFLGDAGSTFIAFMIAWFAIDLSQADVNTIKPITILWILALPLFDLVNVCAFRITNGISPFKAGRDHLHHILHMRGINTTMSTFLMCLLSLVFGLTGLLLNEFAIKEGWSFAIYMSTLCAYLYFISVVRDK